jgi:hypothetical protein
MKLKMKSSENQSTDSAFENFHFVFFLISKTCFEVPKLLIHFACESELNIVPPITITQEIKHRIGTSKIGILKLKIFYQVFTKKVKNVKKHNNVHIRNF